MFNFHVREKREREEEKIFGFGYCFIVIGLRQVACSFFLKKRKSLPETKNHDNLGRLES